ncbi:MAG: hydrolase [Gammaproteobacteria bacterium]
MSPYPAFQPSRLWRNPHAQTLIPATGRVRQPAVIYERLVHALPDSDSLAVDRVASSPGAYETPILVVLHGLEGSSDSTYARALVAAASARNWMAQVLHFRDCGDHRNTLPRRYHAGETGDIDHYLSALRAQFPERKIFVAGYSLGGNALLKYLGEAERPDTIDAAVAVSVPFELQGASDAVSSGFSRLYQYHLMRNMKRALAEKFTPEQAPFDYAAAMRCVTFEAFDDLVTAPLHGFGGKDGYYGACSCRQFLGAISTPTLIVHAHDDPFTSPAIIPSPDEVSDSVTLEVTERGGHVGFIEGRSPATWRFWLPGRILHYLQAQHDSF